MATLHNELYQSPEEYSEPEGPPVSSELTADPAQHLSLKHKEAPLVTKSLLSILPFEADLPKVSEMPLLSWDGANSLSRRDRQLGRVPTWRYFGVT